MNDNNKIVITGIEIPFWQLTGTIVQFSLACIPAGIMIGILWAIGVAVLGGFLSTWAPK
jgi:uncharacterized membrane protein